MNPGDLRKFLWRFTALSLPLLLVTGSYVIWDPFRVLWPREFGDYYDAAAPVELNRDFVSLEMLTRNHASEKYDSFIFGSSRSFPLHCDSWKKLRPDIRPFHYPGASENLYGVYLKLKYLSENGFEIKNAIIETAPISLRDLSSRVDPTHRPHHRLTGESWLEFQGAYLSWYLTDLFFAKFTAFKLTGKVPENAREYLGISVGQVRIDPRTNDYFWAEYDRELQADPAAFYQRFATRHPRDEAAGPPACEARAIGAEPRKYLMRIREIFKKHQTDYRIVIPPVWDQVCTAPEDLAVLREIFGADKVFAFSGVNDFTRDATNFYDAIHVRPFVGDQLLQAMYEKSAGSAAAP